MGLIRDQSSKVCGLACGSLVENKAPKKDTTQQAADIEKPLHRAFYVVQPPPVTRSIRAVPLKEVLA